MSTVLLVLACVFVFVSLAVAPAANAQTLTTLYNTITEPNVAATTVTIPPRNQPNRNPPMAAINEMRHR